MAYSTDLVTRVKNKSGNSRFFAYLGPMGKTLAANATYDFPGDLRSMLGSDTRKLDAFNADLIAGRLTVLSTPSPVIRDTAPDSPLADPTTQATVNVTGGGASGGNLPAGTYQVAYSFYSNMGETLAAGRSATFTVASGNIPRVTLPALPGGASGFVLYLSDTNAPTAALKKWSSGVNAAAVQDLSSTTWFGSLTFANAAAVPTANTTDGPESRTLTCADGVLASADPSWGRFAE
jgi:hypothetical protein